MSLRSTHLKVVGVAGAALLMVGTVASASLAAGTASASYTCGTPLGPAKATASYNAATAPATMSVGQPLATSGTFTLDPTTSALAMAAPLSWSKVSGTITTTPSASQAGLSLSFPKTDLGSGPGGSTVANASGSIEAGSALSPSFTFVLGNLGKVSLTGYKANGSKIGTLVFPSGAFTQCTNDATTTTLMDGATPVAAKLVADKTHTAGKAKYSSKKKAVTGKATVKSRYGFIVPTGKVTFTLKKGTKVIAHSTAKLNKKGAATHVFKGVKAKGKYSITGKYAGSKTMKGSSGKASFRVS